MSGRGILPILGACGVLMISMRLSLNFLMECIGERWRRQCYGCEIRIADNGMRINEVVSREIGSCRRGVGRREEMRRWI